MEPSPQQPGALACPGRVFVLSGPSGVGKNTLAARLCDQGAALNLKTESDHPGERPPDPILPNQRLGQLTALQPAQNQ